MLPTVLLRVVVVVVLLLLHRFAGNRLDFDLPRCTRSRHPRRRCRHRCCPAVRLNAHDGRQARAAGKVREAQPEAQRRRGGRQLVATREQASAA